MITQAYKNYLRSAAWREKRELVFAKHGKKCYACGTFKGPIQVHHLDYSRLGKERVSDLMPLCKPCHDKVTKIYRRNRKRGLRRVTLEFVAMKRRARRTPIKLQE